MSSRVLDAAGVLIFLTSRELRKVTGISDLSWPSIGLEIKLTGYGTAIEVTAANVVV